MVGFAPSTACRPSDHSGTPTPPANHRPLDNGDLYDEAFVADQRTPPLRGDPLLPSISYLNQKLSELQDLRERDCAGSLVPSTNVAEIQLSHYLPAGAPPGLELAALCLGPELTAPCAIPPPPLPWGAGRQDPRRARGRAPAPVPVSLGTVGHPHGCSALCEDMVLHGFCEAGAACKRCHLCPPGKMAAPPRAAAEVGDSRAQGPSIGSSGHPHACGNPCKYRKRKSGCHKGRGCPDCHLCHWTRVVLSTENPQDGLGDRSEALSADSFLGKKSSAAPGLQQWEAPLAVDHEALGRAAALDGEPQLAEAESGPPWFEGCPSVGSLGHPFTCAAACKYATKASGCKDGRFCSRCHSCTWSRYTERHARKGS